MADTPKQPITRADFDAHAMQIFQKGLEQARKVLRETEHMMTPYRAALVHPDQQEVPPKEPN
jgi:hypothetical protein